MQGSDVGENTPPDLGDGYYIVKDLLVHHTGVLSDRAAYSPDLWPESLGPSFQKTCMDYYNQVYNLTEKVTQAMAISSGYDQHYFTDFCTEPMAFYKLLHYPPQPNNAHPLQRGIAAHRDLGVITLLLQDDIAGLEMWNQETQRFHLLPPNPGAFVVNIGNLSQQWTNDHYVSNVHRVINRTAHDRYSIPFHYNGNPDSIVRCIEARRTQPENEKYAPITVNDFVLQRHKDVRDRVSSHQTPSAVHTAASLQRHGNTAASTRRQSPTPTSDSEVRLYTSDSIPQQTNPPHEFFVKQDSPQNTSRFLPHRDTNSSHNDPSAFRVTQSHRRSHKRTAPDHDGHDAPKSRWDPARCPTAMEGRRPGDEWANTLQCRRRARSSAALTRVGRREGGDSEKAGMDMVGLGLWTCGSGRWSNGVMCDGP